MKSFISQLKQRLQNPLPGAAAQLKMSPSVRDTGKFGRKAREPHDAAVLILLYEKQNESTTVFTLRHDYYGPHGGQVCLPGGKRDNSDSDIIQTALREASEETGIQKEDINVIGRLTQLFIPVSNITVYPVIGYLDYHPQYRPDENEVKALIETPLRVLCDPAVRKSETLRFNNSSVEAPYYDIQGHHIWGATAMILSEFVVILCEIEKTYSREGKNIFR